MVREDGVRSDQVGEKACDNTDGKGWVDVVPPAAVGAGVADQDEEGDAKEDLDATRVVEEFGVGEEGKAGHGEDCGGRKKKTVTQMVQSLLW